jgi:hypothetical protein
LALDSIRGRLGLVARRWLLLVGAAAACVAGTTDPGDPPIHGDGRKVLFVGNSLTYFNDLPLLVQAMAESVGTRLAVASVAYPDFSLEDHWNLGTAPATIRRGGWEIVVLQQGPSSLPESRVNLLTWTHQFATEIARIGGRPALYQVWPSAGRSQDFDRASESYAIAAAEVNGILFPGGEAWRAAWRRDPTLALYAPDGLHPSPMGSYLVALVMVARLAERSAVGLPAAVRAGAGQVVSVSPATAALLQAAADEAIAAVQHSN